MKEIPPGIHSSCCNDCDSSYMFRLCKLTIIVLLISEV